MPWLALFVVLSLIGIISLTACAPRAASVETNNMKIGDGEKNLGPGGYVALIIPNHNSGHTNYRLRGLVKSQGGPIMLFLLDDANFKLWEANQPYHAAYTISEFAEEQLQIPIEDKTYYLVAKNGSQDRSVLFQHYALAVSYDVRR